MSFPTFLKLIITTMKFNVGDTLKIFLSYNPDTGEKNVSYSGVVSFLVKSSFYKGMEMFVFFNSSNNMILGIPIANLTIGEKTKMKVVLEIMGKKK